MFLECHDLIEMSCLIKLKSTRESLQNFYTQRNVFLKCCSTVVIEKSKYDFVYLSTIVVYITNGYNILLNSIWYVRRIRVKKKKNYPKTYNK